MGIPLLFSSVTHTPGGFCNFLFYLHFSTFFFNFVMILIRNEQRGLFAGFTFAQVTPDQ